MDDPTVIDQNSWYTLNFTRTQGALTVWQGSQFTGTTSAYFSPLDDDQQAAQQWQFVASPQNLSQYIIRPQYLGGGAWLTADSSLDISVTNTAGPGSLWTIGNWHNDQEQIYLYNVLNGPSNYLAVADGGDGAGSWIYMANAQRIPSEQMQLTNDEEDNINNSTFSSLPPIWSSYFATQAQTSTASRTVSSSHSSTRSNTNTASNTATPLPSQGSNSDDSHHSTPVGAAVGGAVGGVAALVLIVLFALWFIRRRRQREFSKVSQLNPDVITEYHSGFDRKSITSVQEMSAIGAIHETDGTSALLEMEAGKDQKLKKSPTHKSIYEMGP